MRIHLSLLLLVSLSMLNCDAQKFRSDKRADTHDADNTARNERDRSQATAVPTDQAENVADREISANIRKAILADDSLSMDAHNVKIITSNGMVTLRGPVKSTHEKQMIETKAKEVNGVREVTNLLEIEKNG